jgi:hypothetical protein
MTFINVHDHTFNWFPLQRFYSVVEVGTAPNNFELRSRENIGEPYGIPYVQSVADNQPTAFDVMPKGTGGANVGGKSWIHVLNSDISNGSSNWEAIKVGAHLDAMEVGADAGGTGQVLPLNVGGKSVRFTSRVGGGAKTFYGQFTHLGSFNLGPESVPHIVFWPTAARFKAGYHIQFYAGEVFSSSADVGLRRSAAGTFEVTDGAAGRGNLSIATVITTPMLVSALPANPAIGARAFVTDAASQVFGQTVAGAGTIKTPVYFDGAWRVG